MSAAPTDGPGPPRRCRAPALVPSALAVLLLTGACGSTEPSSGARRAVQPSTASAPASTSAASGTDQAGGAPSDPGVPGPAAALGPVAPRALRPVRIAVPSIGVDASMVDLGIAGDGSIEVPHDPDDVGWLATTPSPGDRGPAVVAGHVDSTTGAAVFARLSTLRVGAEVVVTRRNGTTATFTVDGVRTYPQARFPTRSVYGPVPGPALRLITCGGTYLADRGGYQDNVVVYAS